MLDIHLPLNRPKAVAILDVSDGGVSAAVYAIVGGRAVEKAFSQATLTLEERTPEQLRSLVASQVRDALQKSLKQYTGGAIEAVYVVLHAPAVQSRTIKAHVRYDHPVRVQDAMIAQMARESLTSEKLKRERLVEGSVVRVALNGYPTLHPSGQHAEHIDIISLISECDPEFKRAIVSEIQRELPSAAILWRSSMRAFMAFAREMDLQENYCIIDMGADSSQVISVRGTAFAEMTVPLGVRDILSKIAGGKSPEETLGTLRLLERDAAADERASALQAQLGVAEPDIVKTFADALGQLAATRRVCNELLLVTHPELEPWLSRLFSRIDFSQFTVTTLPFNVTTPRSLAQDLSAMPNALLVDVAIVNTEARAAA